VIREVPMYVAECDRCGRKDRDGDYWAWADADQAETIALESDWKNINDRLICNRCWAWDDEGDGIVEKSAEEAS
jgi:hypothetical protein